MNIKELEQYLSDFDNLKDTDHFPEIKIQDYVHYHKEMSLEEFLMKGREIIRQTLMYKKGHYQS